MAVKLITAIKRYVGTAAEIAAFDLTGIPAGSTFFESDTGILKVLNEAGALVQAPGETVALSGSKAQEKEKLTIDNTVGGVALTAAKYAGCKMAKLTVETAQIRFWANGSTPTTTEGHIANPGDIITLDSANDIAAFKAIRTGATSGILQCTYSA